MRAKVHVFLKPGVLDVQGKAVEQALHGLGFGGRGVGGVDVHLDGLADPHLAGAGEADGVQGALDGLALDVQYAGLEEDVDSGFHAVGIP